CQQHGHWPQRTC
nr:immunoglobulin light chain junction region [Macaca mulatta]